MVFTLFYKRGAGVSSRFVSSYYSKRMKTMQAWQTFEYGGPEKLQLNSSAEIPVIRDSLDCLIKVHAASINPLDVEMLAGYGDTSFNFMRQLSKCSLNAPRFPLVLGRDFSGTVVHVGKRVKSVKIGDEVWGALSPWANGSFAEYMLAPVCYISKKPNSLNHPDASSFPYAALTAWSALRIFGGLCEKSSYGKRVLVIGASGGVGTISVQLLKSWGADVTAICSSDATEMLYNLGADTVLDYQSPEFKMSLKEMKKFDLILDNVGKEYPGLCMDLLNNWRNSKYVTLVSPLLKNTDDQGLFIGTFLSGVQAGLDTAMSFKDGKSFRWAYFMPNGCILKKLAQMVDNKQINPVIEKVYPFEEVPHAFEKAVKGHARGKTVINFTAEQDKNQEKHN
ncbi:reticulon-4-interacting protein 1, mitochondrial [Parasteatoda tepidariorum]|uniref:reticulon-4-interacting protein 1, mitochondrial n=1 Tax=Parasteatoda tepidariorum TaxID=114398 RepID=UPI00077FCC7F|nr:reticulon-4-interacting protein 1, mitochondrial [Parasteatoda tepidariorum]XP_015927497.1 reticulon-4-interacting protein 1, mitochondrial [Parasteatoda tepidariorum]XP_015927498.1 reticulon-4-interacting protein 1, mitochondrial [Parasteatoda tepidariorum]